MTIGHCIADKPLCKFSHSLLILSHPIFVAAANPILIVFTTSAGHKADISSSDFAQSILERQFEIPLMLQSSSFNERDLYEDRTINSDFVYQNLESIYASSNGEFLKSTANHLLIHFLRGLHGFQDLDSNFQFSIAFLNQIYNGVYTKGLRPDVSLANIDLRFTFQNSLGRGYENILCAEIIPHTVLKFVLNLESTHQIGTTSKEKNIKCNIGQDSKKFNEVAQEVLSGNKDFLKLTSKSQLGKSKDQWLKELLDPDNQLHRNDFLNFAISEKFGRDPQVFLKLFFYEREGGLEMMKLKWEELKPYLKEVYDSISQEEKEILAKDLTSSLIYDERISEQNFVLFLESEYFSNFNFAQSPF